MNKSKKLATVITYAQIALNLVYAVAFTPLLLRSFGPGEYGIYSLCVSVLSYLQLFQFGFSTTFTRYYVQYSTKGKTREKAELCGMFFRIFVVVAILTCVAGFILVVCAENLFGTKITPSEYQLTKILLSLVSMNAVMSVFEAPFQAIITAHEEFVFQKFLLFSETAIKVIILVPIVISGGKSIFLLGTTTFLSLISLILNVEFVLFQLKVPFSFSRFDSSLFKEIISFSFFIFLQSIMDIFNWQIDYLLIARYCGSARISTYSIGAQLNSAYMSLCVAITGFYVPRANRIVAAGADDCALTNLMIRLSRIQFVLTTFLSMAFIFFGQSFIDLYAGSMYKNAYWVALLLILPLILPLSMDLWYHIARAKSLHKTSTVIFTLVAVLNLIISIPLCKRYGEIGAAAGTCIGMLFANNIFQPLYAHFVVKLDMRKWALNLLQMTPALLIPAIFGASIMLFIQTNTICTFVIWAFIYTIISAVSYWCFALNEQEKEELHRMLICIFKKFIKRNL